MGKIAENTEAIVQALRGGLHTSAEIKEFAGLSANQFTEAMGRLTHFDYVGRVGKTRHAKYTLRHHKFGELESLGYKLPDVRPGRRDREPEEQEVHIPPLDGVAERARELRHFLSFLMFDKKLELYERGNSRAVNHRAADLVFEYLGVNREALLKRKAELEKTAHEAAHEMAIIGQLTEE